MAPSDPKTPPCHFQRPSPTTPRPKCSTSPGHDQNSPRKKAGESYLLKKTKKRNHWKNEYQNSDKRQEEGEEGRKTEDKMQEGKGKKPETQWKTYESQGGRR